MKPFPSGAFFVTLVALPVLIGCGNGSPASIPSVKIDRSSLVEGDVTTSKPSIVSLIGFEHRGPNSAYLSLSNAKGLAEVRNVSTGEVRVVDYDGTGYLITFFDEAADNDGQLDTHTFEISFEGTDGVSNSISLVRQSPSELREVGIEKADGYTVLAANTLNFSDADANGARALTSDYTAGVELPRVRASRSEMEFQIAAAAAAWINNQSLQYGGAPSLPQGTLNDQIQSLKRGKTGLSSASFRTLWMQLVYAAGVEVRAVDFTSYGPVYDDLTPYSYGLAEMTVRGRWVAVDPIGNAVFEKGGELLSAKALRDQIRLEPNSVVSIALVDGQVRNMRGGSSIIVTPITSVKLEQYAGSLMTVKINWSSSAAE